jgi:diacylglycerol kinase (ATP)
VKGVRLLVNPAAGRGTGARRLDDLRRWSGDVGADLHVSRGVADLVEMSRRAAQDGVERLVVAGGDGTLHHALQGLAGSSTALAAVPLGRGNDLAAELGVPGKLRDALAHALAVPVSTMDLGRIEGDGESGAEPVYFGIYAGGGFDSAVASYANRRSRLLHGSLVYPWAMLRTLVRFRAPRIRLERGGDCFAGRALFVTAANATRFGGGMRIAPGASLVDGQLDLVLVQQVSKLELLWIFPRVYAGRHVGHRRVVMARSGCARLGFDPPLTLYADGEPVRPVGWQGVTLTTVPAALRVVGVPGRGPVDKPSGRAILDP